MEAGYVLGIDIGISSPIGLAVLDKDGKLVSVEQIIQPEKSAPINHKIVRMCEAFSVALSVVPRHGGVIAGFEVPPFIQSHGTHGDLNRMCGAIMAMLYTSGIPMIGVTVPEGKSAFGLSVKTGSKSEMVRWANLLYGTSLTLKDEHAADAIAIARSVYLRMTTLEPRKIQ